MKSNSNKFPYQLPLNECKWWQISMQHITMPSDCFGVTFSCFVFMFLISILFPFKQMPAVTVLVSVCLVSYVTQAYYCWSVVRKVRKFFFLLVDASLSVTQNGYSSVDLKDFICPLLHLHTFSGRNCLRLCFKQACCMRCGIFQQQCVANFFVSFVNKNFTFRLIKLFQVIRDYFGSIVGKFAFVVCLQDDCIGLNRLQMLISTAQKEMKGQRTKLFRQSHPHEG